VLQSPRAPETRANDAALPTYGELMDLAERAAHSAIALARDGHLGFEAGHVELLGYERFLRTCGAHLGLLSDLAADRPSGVDQLARLLRGLPAFDASHSAWRSAAVALGVAHDLVATHLGPERALRSPDIADIIGRRDTLGTSRPLMGLLLEAADANNGLLGALRNQRRRHGHLPMSTTRFRQLIDANEALLLHAKAALWDLDASTAISMDQPLAQLELVTRMPGAGMTPIRSPLRALLEIRRVSFAQSRGEAPASPASLRDLALLGAQFSHPDAVELPAPPTPLERLERAHLADLLQNAYDAWTDAAAALGHHIQGVTKAPGSYGQAIGYLLGNEHSTAVRLAIVVALPRLGQEASHTIDRLKDDRALATPRREPGKVRVTWEPAPLTEFTLLRERFRMAAKSSADAAAALRRLTDEASPSQRANCEPSHVLQQTRSRGHVLEASP